MGFVFLLLCLILVEFGVILLSGATTTFIYALGGILENSFSIIGWVDLGTPTSTLVFEC